MRRLRNSSTPFHRVLQGRTYLSHEVASEVVFTEAKSAASPFKSLTLRELQMLQMISEGKPYGIIAQELNVSYKTVANTCSLIKGKIGARSLPELMRIALKHLPQTPGTAERPGRGRTRGFRDLWRRLGWLDGDAVGHAQHPSNRRLPASFPSVTTLRTGSPVSLSMKTVCLLDGPSALLFRQLRFRACPPLAPSARRCRWQQNDPRLPRLHRIHTWLRSWWRPPWSP